MTEHAPRPAPLRVEAARRVRAYARRFGSRRTLAADARAGVVLGVESVPDGLAAGLLAGVNPLHGLYGYIAGTLGGALATGSVFMSVQATGAMSVIISDVPQTADPATAAPALTMLAVLTGVIMLVLGLARLGALVRFIPTAVLVGFVNAVAVNIVLGQLGNITGYAGAGANRLARTADTFLHLPQFHWPSVAVAAATVGLTLLLERTRLRALGMVVAVGLGSALAVVLPGTPVQLLSDVAQVPNALPLPQAPDLALIPALIVPAVSLALVGLVQGAAISGSIPNPDGRYPDASADFRGQGVANVVAGVFQGMPVGGSMSATSLVRAAGARSAAANLIAAVVMCVVVLVGAGAIGYTAMPALGALLVIVGVRSFRPSALALVWRTGPIQATVLVVTFAMTLLIPLQYAVLTGVGLAVVLHVVRQANHIRLVRWVFDDAGWRPRETTPPAVITAGDTVVLVPYGSLFFAAAPVLRGQLPEVPATARDAVVVLRLRGTDDVGSTFINVLVDYADRLRAADAELLLVGISDRVHSQLAATGALERIGQENVFPARERVGDALVEALHAVDERRRP